MVNEGIWANAEVRIAEMAYADAVAGGAMALFGEKYGDVVRVVDIPGRSTELCGGTHVRNTGQIGAFRIVSEGGVAAGVRRIEAVTGRGAYELLTQRDQALHEVAARLKVNTPTAELLGRKLDALLQEKRTLEKKLEEALRGGGGQAADLLAGAEPLAGGGSLLCKVVEADDMKALQALGDVLREQLGSGVGAICAAFADGKGALVVVVTDDLRSRGLTAVGLVKQVAARTGVRGGGKEHMAQAGVAAAEVAGMPAIVAEVVRAAAGAA